MFTVGRHYKLQHPFKYNMSLKNPSWFCLNFNEILYPGPDFMKWGVTPWSGNLLSKQCYHRNNAL